jgi:hypothetical protein
VGIVAQRRLRLPRQFRCVLDEFLLNRIDADAERQDLACAFAEDVHVGREAAGGALHPLLKAWKEVKLKEEPGRFKTLDVFG